MSLLFSFFTKVFLSEMDYCKCSCTLVYRYGRMTRFYVKLHIYRPQANIKHFTRKLYHLTNPVNSLHKTRFFFCELVPYEKRAANICELYKRLITNGDVIVCAACIRFLQGLVFFEVFLGSGVPPPPP